MSTVESASPNAAAEAVEAVVAPPPGVGSPDPSVAPVCAHEAPQHYDPLDPEHGWARPRRLGESRLAKVVLFIGLMMAIKTVWMVYSAGNLDPKRDVHTSLITKIWQEGKDFIKQWVEGTNIPH